MKVVFKDINKNRGLFSIIKCIISAILETPQESVDEIKILDSRYAKNGEDAFPLYFRKFLPTQINTRTISPYYHPKFPGNNWRYSFRAEASVVWKRFFYLNDWMIGEVNKVEKELQERTLSIHYRATDKKTEVKVYPPSLFASLCNDLIMDMSIKSVFLATDDSEALSYFLSNLKCKVIYQKCSRSSGDVALHTRQGNDPITIGKETLIDLFLMSKHKYFISGESNMSEMVTVENEKINHIYIR